MRHLKRVIQWTIGVVCGLYLGLQIAMHIPIVQKWAGSTCASVLRNTFQWNISVGRIRFGLWNRIIIDDINLRDKQDSIMLHASRLAAKIDLLPLIEGRISIANAQLFGTQARLYQMTPDEKPNFQFLLDTFSSNDSTGSPIDLHIGSILLRRADVRWDKCWEPHAPAGTIDPSHLHFRNIAMTAHLRTLTPDSLNLIVKRLSFTEKSGLTLKKLSMEAEAGNKKGEIRKISLQLPNTILSIPSVTATWPSMPSHVPPGDFETWFSNVTWKTEAALRIALSDISAIVPQLKHADSPVRLHATVSGSNGGLNVPYLHITNDGSMDFIARLSVPYIPDKPELAVNIGRLWIDARLQKDITRSLYGTEREISPIITRLDTVCITGRLRLSSAAQSANMRMDNSLGSIHINAKARECNVFSADLTTRGFEFGRLLTNNSIYATDKVTAEILADGMLRAPGGSPKITATTRLPRFTIKGREYKDARLSATLNSGGLSIDGDIDDHGGGITTKLLWQRGKRQRITGDLHIDNMLSESLNLGDRYPDMRLSLSTDVDLTGTDIDDVTGTWRITDFTMRPSNSDSSAVVPLHLTLHTETDKAYRRTLEINSEPLNLYAHGRFRFSTLAGTLLKGLQAKLPHLIPYRRMYSRPDTVVFTADLADTTLLRHLALKDISIPSRTHISGCLMGYDSLQIRGDIPELSIGNEYLRNSRIRVDGNTGTTTFLLTTERRQKHGFVAMSLKASAHDNRLRVAAGIDNRRSPRIAGEMDITATFTHNSSGEREIAAWVAPTDIIISDTLWRIHPAGITWSKRTADIRGFKISQSETRGLEIDGVVSAAEEDTLRLNMRDINVEYIMDLVNFKSVEFSGLATGTAVATALLSRPKADADIRIDGFRFNNAPLGTLRAAANWGEKANFLRLDATIADSVNRHNSIIKGGFNIGDKSIADGLDLKINTTRFNLAFMNLFTKGILEDFQGRATGYCRIFGPFSKIDIEGDMVVDHADFGMPMLGTKYHLRQDNIRLRPGEITLDARLLDDYAAQIPSRFADYSAGETNDIPHTGILKGILRHSNFKRLTYDFSVKANSLLSYDFNDFGENSFYATCIASGDINVRGIPGRLSVDINATPEEGTSFTYNVSTPEALTEAGFLSIRSGDAMKEAKNMIKPTRTVVSAQDNAPASDMFINFNLMVTPEAKMRLLMDRKSGDMIEIAGGGRIMAKYYNKGRFNIYGTYRVQDGNYRLNLQDIIRKDFRFQPDGTITFGGDAMKADINLQAVYTVNSVSLDDITDRSLGFSKTRVNCIMNLTGHPEQPMVTFDFELPDATEDERQMVHSIVGSEEERNMQAIYLLGLGRFYNFETAGIDQSGAAMNSLVSSTLSAQLNQFISNAVGSSKWSIGTSLKTGEDGWRNMDVEGLLSGRMFDDRLLVTGNFGYREKYYTQRSFISDVTVEYLLTKNGNISLKAYNQANDRYFIQSSLNTQGIGIQCKKDFNRFTDLFKWLR